MMIYFIRLGSGAIKIGFTNDLDGRMNELRKHYGCVPIVLKTMDGDKRKERQIHKQFVHLRYDNREQFRPAPDLMEFIGHPPIEDDPLSIEPHAMKEGIRINNETAKPWRCSKPSIAERRSTVSEIAHELGCHPSAVVRWITRGAVLKSGERIRLKAVKTPGGWRISRPDLEAFLAALTADSLREETPASKQPAKGPRIAAMRAGLAENGF